MIGTVIIDVATLVSPEYIELLEEGQELPLPTFREEDLFVISNFYHSGTELHLLLNVRDESVNFLNASLPTSLKRLFNSYLLPAELNKEVASNAHIYIADEQGLSEEKLSYFKTVVIKSRKRDSNYKQAANLVGFHKKLLA